MSTSMFPTSFFCRIFCRTISDTCIPWTLHTKIEYFIHTFLTCAFQLSKAYILYTYTSLTSYTLYICNTLYIWIHCIYWIHCMYVIQCMYVIHCMYMMESMIIGIFWGFLVSGWQSRCTWDRSRVQSQQVDGEKTHTQSVRSQNGVGVLCDTLTYLQINGLNRFIFLCRPMPFFTLSLSLLRLGEGTYMRTGMSDHRSLCVRVRLADFIHVRGSHTADACRFKFCRPFNTEMHASHRSPSKCMFPIHSRVLLSSVCCQCPVINPTEA